MAKTKTSSLVDQFGRPIVRELLTTEVAGPSIAGVRSPLGGYPGDGLNPGRLASILREADQGEPLRYLELAETIEERDHHYTGVLGTRKRSVSQLEISVADDEGVDKNHAEMIRAWLARDELQGELFDILDAIGKGVSFTEIIWDTSEGQWRPLRLEWRDPRWFRYRREDGRTPLLRTEQGDVELMPFKFITATIRAKSGLPIRSGIARVATWSWMFKAFSLRDWAIFVQTFGQPIRIGKYAPNASEAEKETLFRAVSNIAGDCAAIIPEGMSIEFEAAGDVGASHALYKERADWLDQQVSKLVLGQTATTDSVTGGLGSGKEHRQVQEDIERADARDLSAIVNRDLIRPWVALEYGPQKVYPRVRIGRAEEQDVSGTVDAVTKLVPLGLRVGQKQMRSLVNLAEPAANEELLQPPASQLMLPGAIAAAPAPQDGTAPAPKTGADGTPALDPALADFQLNGAQIESVMQVIQQLMAGNLPAEVAAALIAAVGIPEQRAKEMAAKAAAFKPATPAGSAAPPAAATPPALHAQQADAVDETAREAETVAAPAADQLIDAVKAVVLNATSLKELEAGLAKLKPTKQVAALTEALAQATAYAVLAGRSEIADAG